MIIYRLTNIQIGSPIERDSSLLFILFLCSLSSLHSFSLWDLYVSTNKIIFSNFQVPLSQFKAVYEHLFILYDNLVQIFQILVFVFVLLLASCLNIWCACACVMHFGCSACTSLSLYVCGGLYFLYNVSCYRHVYMKIKLRFRWWKQNYYKQSY